MSEHFGVIWLVLVWIDHNVVLSWSCQLSSNSSEWWSELIEIGFSRAYSMLTVETNSYGWPLKHVSFDCSLATFAEGDNGR